MKRLAALLACVPMSGCVIHWPPGRDHPDAKRGPLTVVVCVMASCRDIFKPKQQETPTPASSTRKSESATDLQASRLEPGARRQGIGPNKR